MSGQVGPYGNLQLEFGPVPWKNPADSEKFRQAEYQVLRARGGKDDPPSPRVSRVFERHKLAVDFDRLYQRLRELNSEIEKLRLEIGGESGLSPAQLAERLADLSKQELATRLSLDVMKARSGALREQIDKIKVTAELKVAENQSIRTLKRIVDLRKRGLRILGNKNPKESCRRRMSTKGKKKCSRRWSKSIVLRRRSKKTRRRRNSINSPVN